MVNRSNERIKEAISTIGEKLSVTSFAIRTKTDNDAFQHLHMGGRIGVLTVRRFNYKEAARDVAMHIAAINPKYVSSGTSSRRNQPRKEKF